MESWKWNRSDLEAPPSRERSYLPDCMMPDGAEPCKGYQNVLKDLDAGREYMRRAWHELNAIRARDGAPPGVSEEYFSDLVEKFSEMLGNDSVPWMTGAARRLIEEHRQQHPIAELERVRDAAQALADHCKKSVNVGPISAAPATEAFLWLDLRSALENAQDSAPASGGRRQR